MKLDRFAWYAWGVLGYNLLVILWGAFVRATGSGAGCGSHWPSCNGAIVPRAESIETLIEFGHRVTSGLALVAVVVMLVWAFRRYPSGHRVRAGATWSLIFIIVEALIGAALVLLEYVATNDSIARAYWMAGHLINTFILLGALTFTAWWASGGQRMYLRGQGLLGTITAVAFGGMLILGASGGITALGDTLHLTSGISAEESVLVAQLVALRVYHPLLAFVVGALVAAAALVAMRLRPNSWTDRMGRAVISIYLLQLVVGALNVALRAPVIMQLVHLLLADLIWIAMVILAAVAFAQPERVVSVKSGSALSKAQAAPQ
jgi:heme A synthase